MTRNRAAILLVGLFGCASITSGQRPQTLGRGNVEVGIESSYQAAFEPDTVSAFPMVAASMRVGISEHIDVGGRASSSGLGSEIKVLFYEQPNVRLAVAPRTDWTHAFDDGIGFDALESAVPVLSSFRLRPGLELLASARAHSSLFAVKYSDTSIIHTLGVGGAGGVASRVGPVWLVGELGVLYPFLVTGKPADEMGGTRTRTNRLVTQLSFSVLFGGGKQ